jgi:hypothetical protein
VPPISSDVRGEGVDLAGTPVPAGEKNDRRQADRIFPAGLEKKKKKKNKI